MRKYQSYLCACTLILTVPLCALPSFGAVIGGAQAQKDGRGLRVQPTNAVASLPVGSKRYAVVIGVDEYEDSQINKLDGAGNDAKAIVEALVQYAGFPRDQVKLLTSDQPVERRPTRNKIL